jgi:acetoin utilization protein AcuB
MDEASTALAEVRARLGNENQSALRLALSSVGELMATEVVTLQPTQSVQEAIALFGARRFRHVLVTEGKTLVGVVSDRDVYRFLAQNPTSKDTPVSAVMTRKPLTVRRDATVADAISQILHNRINCLPVVADGGTVEGILTTTDLLRALYALQQWLERFPRAVDPTAAG